MQPADETTPSSPDSGLPARINPTSEKSRTLIDVQVDDREAGQPVLLAFREHPEVQARVQRLIVGDYQLGGRLVVERKTVRDFAASIIDGRLFRQATQLSRCQEQALVILEGSGRELNNTGVSREAIQGALISLSLVFHLPVLRSLDPTETARLMLFAWQQISRQEEDSLPLRGRRPRRRKRAQLQLLQGLPLVGPKRALQLLDRFGTVRNVFKASTQDLLSIPGIKHKTVKAFEWVLD